MKYLLILLSFFYLNVLAIEPNEILKDKDLEKIAIEISKELRCLVCQNEDIHNSNADIAKDLSVLVSKKLESGESKKEILKYVHDRYGDFVLFSPPFKFQNIGLWIIPLLFFLLMTFFFFRKS